MSLFLRLCPPRSAVFAFLFFSCFSSLQAEDLAPGVVPAKSLKQNSDSTGWICADTRKLTSNFCELRGRRYHAGIDLSTHGGVGHDLLSPVDGHVLRIGASYWGYGKQLLIEGRDGRQYLFAHLLDFRDDLEDYLLERQLRTGRYKQNLYPDGTLFPIAQGEVFARSGDTGSGPAHIHMEVRRAGSRALNPLLNGFSLPDSRNPQLLKLAVFPAESGSRIAGSFYPQFFDFPANPNNMVLDIPVEGKVFFALRCQDRINGSSNRLAPWRIQLFQQDSLVFQSTFDDFPFALNHQVCEEINRWCQQRLAKVYHNLFRPAGQLPFVDVPQAGTESSKTEFSRTRKDTLQLVLKVLDAAKNSIRATIRLVPDVGTGKRTLTRSKKSAGRNNNDKLAKFWWQGGRGALRCPLIPESASIYISRNGVRHVLEHLSSGGSSSAWFRIQPTDSLVSFGYVDAGERVPLSPLWQARTLNAGQPEVSNFTFGSHKVQLGFGRQSLVSSQVLLVHQDSSGLHIGPDNLRIVEAATLEIDVPDSLRALHLSGKVGIYLESGEERSWQGSDRLGDRLSARISWPGLYIMRADTTAPQILLRGNWATKTNADPRIEFRCSDRDSGIKDIRMWIDQQRVMARYDPEGDRVLYRPRHAFERGTHRLRLEAWDEQGNRSEVTQKFSVH